MPGRHILHVDANSFYSSVEMQENPTLRGKRIAVCGSKEDRHGIVLTASYPAKRMGVKTGMAIWEAQRCCRDLIIVPPHYREYMRYSGYMREILQDYTDQVEAFGLDESWADVSGSVGLFGSAMTIAREISERVKRELGITVSIGVSDNKVTAKLGSDYKKPDAITRIEADNYKEIVYPLPVQDLLYVGHATQRKPIIMASARSGSWRRPTRRLCMAGSARWGTRCPPSPAGWTPRRSPSRIMWRRSKAWAIRVPRRGTSSTTRMSGSCCWSCLRVWPCGCGN